MKKLLIAPILVIVSTVLSLAQNQAQYFILNEPLTGNQHYQASKFIEMGVRPGSASGFYFSAESGNQEFQAEINPYLIFPPEEGEFGGPEGLENIVGSDGVVGAMEGDFNVSESGSAIYNIPIKVPSGIAGMTPVISLNYNNQNGIGLLGNGWDISGISAITKTAPTLYYDGELARYYGGEFKEDCLLLDGVRLIMQSSNKTDDGRGLFSEFRKENDDFTKINYELPGDGSVYVIAATKGGLNYRYGGNLLTGSSMLRYIVPSGQIAIWGYYINEISDRFNNTIKYDYYNGNGTLRPKSISYSDYIIEFHYDEELNEHSSYHFELGYMARVAQKYHLREITCKHIPTGEIVKKYAINYLTRSIDDDPNFLAYYVESIQEFGRNDEKYNKTVFRLEDEIVHGKIETTPTTPIGSVGEPIIIKTSTGNFTGNSFSDVLIETYDPDNKTIYYNLYRNGNYSGNIWPTKALIHRFPIGCVSGDFNSDGRDDFISVSYEYDDDHWLEAPSLCEVNYYKSEGSGFSERIVIDWISGEHPDRLPKETYTGDFNGDGILDLMLRDGEGRLTFYLGNPSGTFSNFGSSYFSIDPKYKIIVGNFRTSNRNDFFVYGDKQVYAGTVPVRMIKYLMKVGNFYQLTNIDVMQEIETYKEFIGGDFNGDGKTDLVNYINEPYNKLTKLKIFHSFGAGFYLINQDDLITYAPEPLIGSLTGEIRINSCNHDGNMNSDLSIIYTKRDNDNFYKVGSMIFFNKSGKDIITKHIIDQNQNIVRFNNMDLFTFADLDFNGASDLLVTSQYDFNFRFLLHKNSNYSITKITNGLGQTIDISYSTLKDNQTYTVGNYNTYPVRQIFFPMKLVSKVLEGNGMGGKNEHEYKYLDGLIHLAGKGFLGFTSQTAIDKANSIEQTDKRKLNGDYWVLIPDYTASKIRTTNAIFAISQYTFKTRSWGNKNFLLFAETIVDKDFEINGNLKAVKKTVYYTNEGGNRIDYDDYGNSLYTQVSTGTSESALNHKSTVRNYYNNTVSKWILGRLYKSLTTYEAPGKPNITKQVQFDYYGSSATLPGIEGMLKSEKVMAGNNIMRYKEYKYDEYGNIISSSLNDASGEYEKRETNTEYDHYLQNKKGRFLTLTTNALGHNQEMRFDEATGNMAKSIDINGLETSFFYDGMGRQFKTISPIGVTTQRVLRWVLPDTPDQPDGTNDVFYSWEQSSGGGPVIVFYDNLGREVRVVTCGLTQDQKIYVDTEYDSRGNILKKYEAYFAGSTQKFYTKYSYDALNRPDIVTLPGNNGVIDYDYYMEDGLFVNKLTNSKNQVSYKYYNSSGLLVKSVDHDGSVVNNEYYSDRNLESKQNGNYINTKISYQYDILRRLLSINEPAQGLTKYEYNAFDEITKVYLHYIQGNEPQSIISYDKLGRVINKAEPEGTYRYEYDSRPNSLGRLCNESSPGHSIDYYYDEYGNLLKKDETIFSETFSTIYAYDIFSRISNYSYPSGYNLTYSYNELGHNTRIDDNRNKNLWKVNELDAKGQIKSQVLSERYTVTKTFDDATGRLTQTRANNIQNNMYSWDSQGYLIWRKDVGRNLTESFYYDYLNRITSVRKNGTLTSLVSYDDYGNIHSKTGVGTYSYDINGPNPYKITGINSLPIGMEPFNHQYFYTSFDKVNHIIAYEENRVVSNELFIDYGTGYQRIRQKTGDKTIIYAGREFEKQVVGNVVNELHYIYSPEGLIGIYTKIANSEKYETILKDHLGSVQFVITDDNSVLELSYDAWGNRRDPATWNLISNVNLLTGFGFTGHEHLDLFDLINMDGRIYDPLTGAFLSPDIVLQFPDKAIGLNPYSYCLNNPVSFVDPTGYSIGFFDIVKGLMMATVTIASGGSALAAIPLIVTFSVTDGMYAQAKGANVNILKDFVLPSVGFHMLSAGSSKVIGTTFGSPGKNAIREIARASAHGVSSGTIRLAQGGKFEHGFISGFASSLSGSIISFSRNPLINVAITSTIGGTSEVLGGGKFVNGAITSAYTYLFNHYLHDNPPGGAAQVQEGDGKWGFGTYMGGTFAPGVGPTVEVGFIVDSKGQANHYLSLGIAVGVEASAGSGVIVVPQKNFNAKDWFGDGFGGAINIPFTPFSLEYTQSMYNTKYCAGKAGIGVGLGGSANWSYTIILPIVPPVQWSRPGQPR